MIEVKGKFNTAKVFATTFEQEALEQIKELCDQEWAKDSVIRIMPDVHAGKGCVIGTSMTIEDKVCPSLVGVDIGCGMLCCELGNIEIDLEKLDKVIREFVPSGRNVHENKDSRGFGKVLINDLRCFEHLKDKERLYNSVGTLGGGNHFIEVDEDIVGNKYLIIHTGSRNLGHQVATYYQELAYETINGGKQEYENKSKKLIEELKEQGREKEIGKALADLKKETKVETIKKELCYLEEQNMEYYLHDMEICQVFADLNRLEIARIILNKMGIRFNFMGIEYFETIHNYIDTATMILRKGCVDASSQKKLLIPINMRDGCIIGVGKGNEDYNETAPHGAGRLMSRTKAKQDISMEQFEKSMNGIYSTSISKETLDESPMAYKPLEEIIENIKDTVEILDIIKPIYNFKATE